MENLSSDFSATIAIIQPSPMTADMLADLPSIWNTGQNEPQYAAIYGVGLEFENLKKRIKQLQANNTLYSPVVQEGFISVNGSGAYIVEFDTPFVQPPLDVSISGASVTDVFVEFVSRFSMIVNVQTEINDNLHYYVSGFIGAASDEYIGDALQLNFGDLYGFQRMGSSVIDDSFVSFYETTNVLINATNIIPVQNVEINFDSNGNPIGSPIITENAPPINSFYLKGIITTSEVITEPHTSHQLLDFNGSLIALVDATTITNLVSAYYPTSGNNPYKTNNMVYIIGTISQYTFDRWNQPSYQQEVFRADSQYRRILSAINKAIFLGPTIKGLSNMVEALISQPFIPFDFWKQSDYRIFSNNTDSTPPKFLSYKKDSNGIINGVISSTQMEGYPTVPPLVEVRRIKQSWSPTKLTYNNKPDTESLDVFTAEQITQLNKATRFDITNEIIRQLRLGLDAKSGGVINWNYANLTNIPASGANVYETYNYVFLNNANDEPDGISLYWHAQQFNSNGPTGYRTYGPLKFGKDYFVVSTNNFKNADGSYALPSELLQGYNANSSIPYQSGLADTYGNTIWLGQNLASSGTLASVLPNIPTFLLQIDLTGFSLLNNNSNNIQGISNKMPTNIYDYIIYSYSQVALNSTYLTGNFIETQTSSGIKIASYYDSNSSSSLQPLDSPFINYSGNLLPNSLAQSPFSKFITSTGYEYILDMRSGNASFSKTILTQVLKSQVPLNPTSMASSAPGILVLQANKTNAGFIGVNTQVGNNQYIIQGIVSKAIAPNGQRYFPYYFGDYVLLDNNGNPIAIFDSSGLVNFSGLVGTEQTVFGNVLYTLWDTRIAVSEYRTDSPVFQALSNDATLQFETLVPDITDNALNLNFMVKIFGLPFGVEQNITATWSFNIRTTNNFSNYVSTALGFSDRYGKNNQIIRGIMSIYSGIAIQENGLDPDGAQYNQTYLSGSYSASFLNYNDYINTIGTSLTPFGDKNTLSTLTNPVTQQRIPGQPISGTVLNYFIPSYGFISASILPNQTFYSVGSGANVDVVRPNNNGLCLQISGDSYAGLTFYVNPTTKIVDKPTRLIADFIFENSNSQIRKKTVEVGNGGFAGWVDAFNPDKVQDSEVFYLAGNMFKYAGQGYDQAENQYASNEIPTNLQAGSYYDRIPEVLPDGSSSQPIYEVDPILNNIQSVPGALGDFGPVMRYRRPPIDNSSGSIYATPQLAALQQNYYNISPEKIAFIQFDLSSFPYDTIINNAILEIYFASGFTIKEAKNINFTLNKNSLWSNSRLSGNGKTYLKTLTNPDNSKYTLYSSAQNSHWRKNFLEIVIPYAFYSEPNGTDFGIANLFNFGNKNSLPQSTNPTPCLEYLGYVNIDEISVAGLSQSGVENTVGLTNIILSSNALIFQVSDILSFEQNMQNGSYILLNCIDTKNGLIYANTTDCPALLADVNAPNNNKIIGRQINQIEILPNMKLIIFPFADDLSTYFYGYCTTILPSEQISFDANNISVYQQVIQRVMPLYAQYRVSLLEADTYNVYKTFSSYQNENTQQDISY